MYPCAASSRGAWTFGPCGIVRWRSSTTRRRRAIAAALLRDRCDYRRSGDPFDGADFASWPSNSSRECVRRVTRRGRASTGARADSAMRIALVPAPGPGNPTSPSRPRAAWRPFCGGRPSAHQHNEAACSRTDHLLQGLPRGAKRCWSGGHRVRIPCCRNRTPMRWATQPSGPAPRPGRRIRSASRASLFDLPVRQVARGGLLADVDGRRCRLLVRTRRPEFKVASTPTTQASVPRSRAAAGGQRGHRPGPSAGRIEHVASSTSIERTP